MAAAVPSVKSKSFNQDNVVRVSGLGGSSLATAPVPVSPTLSLTAHSGPHLAMAGSKSLASACGTRIEPSPGHGVVPNIVRGGMHTDPTPPQQLIVPDSRRDLFIPISIIQTRLCLVAQDPSPLGSKLGQPPDSSAYQSSYGSNPPLMPQPSTRAAPCSPCPAGTSAGPPPSSSAPPCG